LYAERLVEAGEAEFKTDLVKINVSVQSNIFIYKVTNLGNSPINSFEIGQHVSYNFQAPEGWQKDSTRDSFKAWAENHQRGIEPNCDGEFSLRVSSTGAVLGRSEVKLETENGQKIIVAGVWTSAAESKSYIFLVGGLIIFIVLGHTVLTLYRKRSGSS
jgi:hypothetical protein